MLQWTCKKPCSQDQAYSDFFFITTTVTASVSGSFVVVFVFSGCYYCMMSG